MKRHAAHPSLKHEVPLRRIVIDLAPHESPTIRLEGRPKADTAQAERYSEATITTRYLTPEATAFIQSMVDVFSTPRKA